MHYSHRYSLLAYYYYFTGIAYIFIFFNYIRVNKYYIFGDSLDAHASDLILKINFTIA